MTSISTRSLFFAAASATMIVSSAQAGGLADAITEREPEVIEQAPPAEMPSWVVPAVALLLIGVAVAASKGGGSDDPAPEARETPDEPDEPDEPDAPVEEPDDTDPVKVIDDIPQK
ncbi:hypothetical protein [Yoonia sediminilitoris]|uniref:MYXO-CTERM domain-containing protein n=1 Tax=Yoonia sediminilitoris TaxID=1286148 RepID=A0A2T6KQR1_9RHOB|nr:hypothetical protein [Yoonia sediminilitoris]PUB18903.1 hypothetical protein C8N45_101494 [Yoonia sediminilitoris]RCW99071.1 hypothetical protein DFP92_101494 [Yoonia sediminilitoris]